MKSALESIVSGGSSWREFNLRCSSSCIRLVSLPPPGDQHPSVSAPAQRSPSPASRSSPCPTPESSRTRTSCRPGQMPGQWWEWSPRPACLIRRRSRCACQNPPPSLWNWRTSSLPCHQHSKISWKMFILRWLKTSMKLQNLWRGYWCWIFFVLGSWMATPSMDTVNSALGVLVPSAFLICWLNFSFLIPSFTTSIPLGWSTSVDPRN